ncbi:adenylate kinase family protein [Patescibacteria group bacterium]
MAKLPDIILMGPYGSGKGTQISFLADKYSFVRFEIGKVLREEVVQGTEIGKRSEKPMNAGELVDPKDILTLTQRFINKTDPNTTILFDGIPRGLEQYEGFLQITREAGRKPIPLYISLTPEESLRRQMTRKICSANGNNIDAKLTVEECEKMGGEVIERAENDPEVAERRTRVYAEQVMPMIEKFREADERFIEIDGMGTREEIHSNIMQALKPYVQD